MKKIIATILSIITVLSLCSMSAFAVLENNNELNQERQVRRRPRNRITEEKRNELKEAFEQIRDQEPNLSNQQICERVGQEFEIGTNTVRRHVLKFEAYRRYQENNRERIHAQQRDYYQANQERIRRYYQENRARIRQYRAANIVRINEQHRKYREKNRARINEQQRQYRAANRARVNEQQRQYRAVNRARINEQARQYYQEHKDRIRQRRIERQQ